MIRTNAEYYLSSPNKSKVVLKIFIVSPSAQLAQNPKLAGFYAICLVFKIYLSSSSLFNNEYKSDFRYSVIITQELLAINSLS